MASRERPGWQELFYMTQGLALPHFSFAKIINSAQKGRAMNKAELIESVQKGLGADATKRSAEEAVAVVLEAIKTGEAMKIKASKSVGFKPSSTLKASL